MATTKSQPMISAQTRTEVTYEWRTFLKFFTYRVEVKATELYDTLFIESHSPFRSIVLNGRVIYHEASPSPE